MNGFIANIVALIAQCVTTITVHSLNLGNDRVISVEKKVGALLAISQDSPFF